MRTISYMQYMRICLFLFAIAVPVTANSETDSLKSDKQTIEAVNTALNDLLEIGDYFAIITFGDNTELVISQQILYEHERELIKRQLKALNLKKQEINIASAVEKANELITSLNKLQESKALIMILPDNKAIILKKQNENGQKVSPVKAEIKKNIIFKFWQSSFLLYIATVICFIVLIILIVILIRRVQDYEMRIEVTAKDIPLGDPMILRRKNSFTIANGYLGRRSVSAKGLNCKIAAKVTYLGRKKFEIQADEAKILDEGKECDRLRIGMDSYFDLKDKDGKTLPLISISKPGRSSDPFGSGYDDNPF
ncbi:MAG: VWA domain-containing protein [Desulfobacteraceae bacterium]|nr:VWA domain-containing protein [Desulfobacteraceae bacterium]